MAIDLAGGSGGTKPDDDALPWLEAVEDEDARRSPGITRLIIGVCVGVVLFAAAITLVGWWKNRESDASGDGEVIAAPKDPYRVRPANTGGMKVEGAGDTVYAAGAGEDPGGLIDLSAMPEQPVERAAPPPERGEQVLAGSAKQASPAAPAKPAPAPVPAKPAPVVAKPAPPPKPTTVEVVRVAPSKPKPALPPAPKPVETAAPAASGGGGAQLGAFSSQAKAEAAWKTLSGRFAFLSGQAQSVQAATVGGKTVYRLRVGGIDKAAAASLCGKLKVAGESCSVVGQ